MNNIEIFDTNDIILVVLIISFIVYNKNNLKEFYILFIIGFLWIIIINIRGLCHIKNFTGITYSIISSIVFIFKALFIGDKIDIKLFFSIILITLSLLINRL